MKIRDYVQVVAQPTIVRLDHLHEADPQWISASYYITEEIRRHLDALRALLARPRGTGLFLIGHFGSGKSHFLAYLAQQLQSGSFAGRTPAVTALSLLHFRSSQSLESIIYEALGAQGTESDRRQTWKAIAARYPSGLFLIVDELSEFLRSKPSVQSFNEDLRFLQFLGEWAADRPLWIMVALQEQIEHTGDIEYDLYRKIKDRFPIRFLLTPTHVKDLIAHRILGRTAGYDHAIHQMVAGLKEIYPEGSLDYAEFCALYPLHPATMELLEEVRDRFSQARGIIDFTLTRMLGDEARHVEPFLDMPWGHLLTPDIIVDHFADLFEVQPEFLPIAQRLLPHFRKQVPLSFPKEAQQELAWRLLKLLVLVHLSPRRKTLTAEQAAQWLLLKISRVDPDRNRDVIKGILDALVEQGAFIKRHGGRYSLDLEDAAQEDLDQLVARSVEEVRERGELVFESILPCLQSSEFNPFALPRDRWHTRNVRWHFHDWKVQTYIGAGIPPEQKELGLQVALPWGPPAGGARCFKVQPRRMELTPEMIELAALCQLSERPLAARVLDRVRERIAGRSAWFWSLVRSAYSEAFLLDPADEKVAGPQPSGEKFSSWLNAYAEMALRLTYPLFERFAPGYGQLPREYYRQFMKHAVEEDLGAELAPESVRLIREAYLVPMGLMKRQGSDYAMMARLENHELVRLIAPVIEHHAAPDRVYQHLSVPPYGLVEDQIHLLLMVLLAHGQIDIVKADRSMRDIFDTLVSPLQYDKILPGRALALNQVRELEAICQHFKLPVPRQWTVLSQKRAVDQLIKVGSRQRTALGDFLSRLRAEAETEELQAQLERLISHWLALEQGDNELQAFEHFLFAIGTSRRFLADMSDIAMLAGRHEGLMREARRFRHLLAFPCVSRCSEADIAVRVQGIGETPPLSLPGELESWLEKARSLYREYLDWYRDAHESWRRLAGQHRLWSYVVPAVARARYLALAPQVRELESLQAKARSQKCAGLAPLDFQPMCRCGFDGSDAPLDETLRQFEALSDRLEKDLALFFQQARVKSKVREWADLKLELNTQTLSYLEGKAEVPQVENVALFEQHFSGLDLVQAVPANALLDLIGERTWEKSALLKELGQFLDRVGPRIAVRRDEPLPRNDLVLWCCEQGLRHGSPLPAGLSQTEQALAAGAIRPDWVGEHSLRKLEEMGLGEEAVLKILGMVLDGLVRLPEAGSRCGALLAAADLVRPERPATAVALAVLTASLYRQNRRFLKLRPAAWLARLNGLADSGPAEMPPPLHEVLQGRLGAQWVIVDCLGLPLLETVQASIRECLPNWRLESVACATTPVETTTDAFYRSLIERGLGRRFEKIDAVDVLIHSRRVSFDDLARLARAELEVAFRKVRGRLEPESPVLVFGDHGFRLSPDGADFTHGGSSPLERLTAVFTLVP